MRAALWASLVAGVTLGLLVGCGGGGSGGTTPPTTQVGVMAASVNLGGESPSNLQVMLDGTPVSTPVGADGKFRLAGVPAGEHVVDVVTKNGFRAGRAVATVVADDTTEVPIITLEGAGIIAGVVTKAVEGKPGGEPLAKVEVIARNDVYVIMKDGTATLAPEGSDGTTPLIYPAPEPVKYSAFTDEDGLFVMKGVKTGFYLVAVTVPGLTTGQAWVSVDAGQLTQCNFQLQEVIEPGVGTVKGTVTGKTPEEAASPIVSKPLEGAEVAVVMNGDGWVSPPMPEPMPVLGERAQAGLAKAAPAVGGTDGSGANTGGDSSGGVTVMPPDIIWREFRTLTDAAGAYTLNVPSGRGVISVWAEGYAGASDSLTLNPRETVVKDFLLDLLPTTVESPAGGK